MALFVDDLFVATTNPSAITTLHQELTDKYGDVKIHTGKIHNYLGMQFDFSIEGEVSISMQAYVDKLLEEWKDQLHGVPVTTPAANNLFEVRDNSPILSDQDRDKFHTATAQLLYLATRTRPDLLLTESYLTTRVQCANKDDMHKLIRCLKYLANTKTLDLRLKPENLNSFQSYIDSAYGLHMDGKSHSGIVQTLGSALLHARSVKQRIVTKSSAEAELVGLSDLSGDPIDMKGLLDFLTDDVGPTTILQDNQATMKMIDNGRSTSSRSKHIAIRYFWLKERTTTGEVKLKYCPTEDMVADILTKPLQGELFLKLRSLILGHG